VIVCDTGPLVAAALAKDPDHHRCVEMFTGLHLAGRQLLVPAVVVAEVGYLLAKYAGAHAEAVFLRSLADGDFPRSTSSRPTTCACRSWSSSTQTCRSEPPTRPWLPWLNDSPPKTSPPSTFAEHVALRRQTGQPVPEPSDAAAVAILDVSAGSAGSLPST
jgi:hypothetical protein